MFLTSVFTHMLPPEVRHYLSEIHRVLRPQGRCLMTFFLLNEDSGRAGPPREANPNAPSRTFAYEGDGYRYDVAESPEAAVGYREKDVLGFLDQAGFELHVRSGTASRTSWWSGGGTEAPSPSREMRTRIHSAASGTPSPDAAAAAGQPGWQPGRGRRPLRLLTKRSAPIPVSRFCACCRPATSSRAGACSTSAAARDGRCATSSAMRDREIWGCDIDQEASIGSSKISKPELRFANVLNRYNEGRARSRSSSHPADGLRPSGPVGLHPHAAAGGAPWLSSSIASSPARDA